MSGIQRRWSDSCIFPASLAIKCLMLGSMVFAVGLLRAAETANARMYCFSPRFQQSEDQSSTFKIDMTTLSVGVNGELAPGFLNSGYSHSTYLIWTDQLFGDEYQGVMGLN